MRQKASDSAGIFARPCKRLMVGSTACKPGQQFLGAIFPRERDCQLGCDVMEMAQLSICAGIQHRNPTPASLFVCINKRLSHQGMQQMRGQRYERRSQGCLR